MAEKGYYRQKTIGASVFNLFTPAAAATLLDELGAEVGLTGIDNIRKVRMQVTGGTAWFCVTGNPATANGGLLLQENLHYEFDWAALRQMSFLQASGTVIVRLLLY